MKQIFYTFTLVFLCSGGVFAQNMTLSDRDDGNKPIIDNVNALILPSDGQDGKIQINLGGSNGQGGAVDGEATETTVDNGLKMQENVNGRSEDKAAVIKRNLRLFPNPAVNYLNIDLGTKAAVEISMVNVIGQEVFNYAGETDKLTVDVAEFAEGTYFLSLKIGKEVIIKRIEVSK